MDYNFKDIEKKWQAFWATQKTFAAEDNSSKPKYYVLDMFPYPSGAGLHVGHPLGYIASDIVARFKRHAGYNVLHPMGYDSFGLPAEQYAIQTGQHPAVTTEQNIARYREQLDKIGFSFDWDRQVKTSDPDYYKWTQWIFIQLFNSWYNPKSNKAENISTLIALFESKGFEGSHHDFFTGDIEHDIEPFTPADWKTFSEKKKSDILMNFRLAYLGEAYVNWCPALGTVLANDEVKDGVSERGGYPVERKMMKQWSMRITAYAQRLLDGLNTIDWTESMKESQRNWIGRSEGSSVRFKLENSADEIEVFTTRPDTIFGVTFVTLAPEHELVAKITTPEYKAAIEEYVTHAKNKSERERMADVKHVSGQFTGAYVAHPFTGNKIPVYIGEYVLSGYGTGAVMAVPGHDERDHRFAKHFGLPILKVVEGADVDEAANEAKEGKMINSDFLNGLEVKDAIKKAIAEIESKKAGQGAINFRLRDAVFGRQRYWGEPIPVYYKDGIPYVLDESELPLELPEVDKFLPTESGEPPLARAKDWVYRPHPVPPRGGGNTVPSFHTSKKEVWPELKQFSRENRKNPTEEEEMLWKRIKGEQLGHKFRRQHVIHTFIADFVCLKKFLVIEVDGGYHEQQKEYDKVRTEIIGTYNFRVIRFTNDEVRNEIERVLADIKQELEKEIPTQTKVHPEEQAQTKVHPEGKAQTEILSEEQAQTKVLPEGKAQTKVLPEGEDLGGAYPLETTTMPGWAGSSWYFLRYMDANNEQVFADRKATDYWQNVDLYIGGSEHATGHLLYVRFWTMALKDLGFISTDEPAKKLINQGMIQGTSALVHRDNLTHKIISAGLAKGKETSLIHIDVNIVDNNVVDIEKLKKFRDDFASVEFELEDGKLMCESAVEKMSKRWHNVVNPDDICERFGADTLRLYEMFLGPLELSKPWNTNGISGVYNFLKRLWRLFYGGDKFNVSNEAPSKAELKTLHKTIKKITEDIERFSFNTSVSSFMICVNELTEQKCNKRAILEQLIVLVSPYAPHIAEELWQQLGHKESIALAKWPEFNAEYLVESSFSYPVSFNGKTRLNIELPLNLSKEQIESEIMAREEVQKYLNGGAPKKVIVVPNKIVNIVV